MGGRTLASAFPVTSIAGLCLFIDDCSHFGLIRGDGDFTLFVENSDLSNSFSLGYIVDDSLIFISSVLDHSIANTETDGFAQVKGFLFRFIENLPRK